jgi:hypothetical protein
VKAAWKEKVLANGTKMKKMHEAWLAGLSFLRLEKEFKLPPRHGMNAIDVLRKWTGRHETAQDPEEQGVHVAPRPQPKISLPEGMLLGSPAAKIFVAKTRAWSLRIRQKELENLPHLVEDLYQDAVQRGLVPGVEPVKLSKEEIAAEIEAQRAKVNNAILVRRAENWWRSES